MKRTLLIADNHPLFRSGVRQLVDESDLLQVLAEVGDGESCLFQMENLQPDCLILDLNLPGKSGFDVATELRSKGSTCRIIVLSMHSSAEFVEHARQIGCNAFVAKEDAGSELVDILAGAGTAFTMSSSAGRGEDEFELDAVIVDEIDELLQRLTLAEQRVLYNISISQTSPDIAEKLNISTRTVHTHRQNICRKLDLTGINSLVRFAVEYQAKIRDLQTS